MLTAPWFCSKYCSLAAGSLDDELVRDMSTSQTTENIRLDVPLEW